MTKEKKILISGIQPTGRLHLGNYLGALKNFIELQNSETYDCCFFVADYHSLTEHFDPRKKPEEIKNLLKDFIAAGLDPNKSILFIQSHIPFVTELAWILSTLTPFGELSRMTQFKDKAQKEEFANVGLFTYPILMAADILLYGAEYVPVGEDQLQHLELARTLARKFNGVFGEIFKEPKALLTKTPRVMSLQNPEKKMSKSDPSGCVFLDDAPEVIEEKIKRAVTDSESSIAYSPKSRPGISNLIEIYSAFENITKDEVIEHHKTSTYSVFKEALSSLISKHFESFRAKKEALNDKEILDIIETGNAHAHGKAVKNIGSVRAKIWLI